MGFRNFFFSLIRQLTSLQNTCFITLNFAPLQVLLFVTLNWRCISSAHSFIQTAKLQWALLAVYWRTLDTVTGKQFLPHSSNQTHLGGCIVQRLIKTFLWIFFLAIFSCWLFKICNYPTEVLLEMGFRMVLVSIAVEVLLFLRYPFPVTLCRPT